MAASTGSSIRPRSPRVERRPDPAQWGRDEPLTVEEAADLFWPDGVITASTLRTAIRTGVLPVARVGRRMFVTPRGLESLGACAPLAERA